MKSIKAVFCAAIISGAVSCGNEETKTVEQPQLPRENPREVMLGQIKKYEAEMHKSMQLDPNTASLAVGAYSEFVRLYPNDSLSPDFIFKSGEISTANQQYKQALMYYETITTKYPSFKLAPESLYLQAYLLDNFLNDEVRAKAIYEAVIAKYPSMPYASDAKAAIKNLGKTDEELIKEFEKKNKGK
jgi:TolA-binding protein